MNRILTTALAGAGALALTLPAAAQTYRDAAGTIVPGTVPIEPGVGPLFTSSNPGVISGFQPTPAYSQLSVSTASSRVALPAGTVVVVYNTGSNAAYVTLGGSSVAATTQNDVIQPNSWMAFTAGSNAYLAGIASSGTTALNISGGSGMPTGAGGGVGGGGSSSISQWAGGTLGAMANYGTSPGAVLVPGVNAFITNTPSVAQSGAPWSQNLTQFGGSNVVTGTGASGAGIPRVTVSNDSQVVTTPKTGSFTSGGQTIGATAILILSAGTYNHVQVQNTSSGNSVACSWFTTTPAINSNNSVQLAAGQSALWGPNTAGVPATALYCIASAASTPLYVESN